MGWRIERDDQDTRMYDEDGTMLLSDTPYYPAIGLSDEDWALVVAAPELLAALRAVVAVADRKTDEFDAARAAIAKATAPLPPFKPNI